MVASPTGVFYSDLLPRRSQIEGYDRGMASATKPTCSATTKRGAPCQARPVRDGLCAMHSGLTDPRAAGRKGGSARRGLAKLRGRQAEDFREHLRREVKPAELLGVIREAMGSSNHQAKISAVRLLETYLVDPPGQEAERDVVRKVELGNAKATAVLKSLARTGLLDRFVEEAKAEGGGDPPGSRESKSDAVRRTAPRGTTTQPVRVEPPSQSGDSRPVNEIQAEEILARGRKRSGDPAWGGAVRGSAEWYEEQEARPRPPDYEL